MASGFLRGAARVTLGAGLIFLSIGHYTFARRAFRAQIPDWVPLTKGQTVIASGVVETAVGTALVVAPRRIRPAIGWATIAFLLGVFPGNISQWRARRDAFGLDTDAKRFARLFLQPVLMVWAWWSTRTPRER